MHVMRVAPAGRATRKAATGIARGESATDRWRNRARLAAHVEDRAVGVVAHLHERGVARQPLRRFRGNVQSTMVYFDGVKKNLLKY